jgi:hypothetical protein
MQKYWVLLPLFCFACKKKEETPRITIRQQPSVIAVYHMDTANSTESLEYTIRYAYDTVNNRYDSIDIGASRRYVFDYTRFSTERIAVATYSDNPANFDQLFYDFTNNILSKYTSKAIPTTDSTQLTFDTLFRIRDIQYKSITTSQNFRWNFRYVYDTIFKSASYDDASCAATDTIWTNYKKFNNQLPYLLFINFYNACGIQLPSNLLMALPTSTNYYNIPVRAWCGNTATDFTYTADAQGRLATFTISTFRKSDTHLLKKDRFVLTY